VKDDIVQLLTKIFSKIISKQERPIYVCRTRLSLPS